jgi:hypothetical protein
LEIKNWCSSEKQLAEKASETASCLANAQGGCLLLGIEDDEVRTSKFKRCPYPNVTPEWIIQRIHDGTVPPLEITVVDARELLREVCGRCDPDCFAVFIPKTRRESGHQTVAGLSKIRNGKDCRPYYVASPDDRTRAILSIQTDDSLSIGSITWGTQQHQRKTGVSAEQWESTDDFLVQLGLLQPHQGEEGDNQPILQMTLACLLLFGSDDALARNRPGLETIVETPVETTRSRANIVNNYRHLCGSPSSLLPSLYPYIPLRCIRELVVNAFVHRSYRLDSPTIIRARPEVLEIETPGGLCGELTPESLLYCTPVYRNFLLADGARYLGICEKVGNGINEVYRGTLHQGLGFPVFESAENRFTVRIFVDRNRNFREFIKVRAQALSQLDHIIVLRYLLDRENATFRELCSVMQRGQQHGKRILDEMNTKMMIERADGIGVHWRLQPGVRADIEHIFSEAQYELGLNALFGE